MTFALDFQDYFFTKPLCSQPGLVFLAVAFHICAWKCSVCFFVLWCMCGSQTRYVFIVCKNWQNSPEPRLVNIQSYFHLSSQNHLYQFVYAFFMSSFSGGFMVTYMIFYKWDMMLFVYIENIWESENWCFHLYVLKRSSYVHRKCCSFSTYSVSVLLSARPHILTR